MIGITRELPSRFRITGDVGLSIMARTVAALD
jgi:hypothetical protein